MDVRRVVARRRRRQAVGRLVALLLLCGLGLCVAPASSDDAVAVPIRIAGGGWRCADAASSIRVAVLSTSDLPATSIDADSVRFGKSGRKAAELRRGADGKAAPEVADVNADGLPDLVFHFRLGDAGFGCADVSSPAGADLPATLTGTAAGRAISGSATLRLLPRAVYRPPLRPPPKPKPALRPAPRPTHPPLQSGQKATRAPVVQDASRMTELDRILLSLKKASIAFNAPTSLHLGDSTRIELVLSLRVPPQQLEGKINAPGPKQSAQIRVADTMDAHLTGIGLTVDPVTPERQPISGLGLTTWTWDIKATETGKKQLHLTLSAVVNVNGDRSQRAIKTFDRVLNVRVGFLESVSGFIGGNWDWLWTAVLVPVGGWIVRNRRRLHAQPH